MGTSPCSKYIFYTYTDPSGQGPRDEGPMLAGKTVLSVGGSFVGRKEVPEASCTPR